MKLKAEFYCGYIIKLGDVCHGK